MTNDEELEAAVLDYLERRLTEPSLTPEEFAAGRGADAGALVGAIRTALELEHMLPGDGEALRTVGPYRILGELGRGGMGIVYRAERDGREYAVKLLPLAPIVGPRMLERFRREASVLAKISHPGIVRVHDTGMHEEMPYLVMDLVDGRPLQEAGPAMSIDDGVALVDALASAVGAAHAQGVSHRDLKPQNVMVRPDGTPVLLDFGLSVADEFPTLTATSEILGTPRYMAPEQVLGTAADARTDVHALGLILYELVTRRSAYREQSREALLDAVRVGRIPSPRAVAAAVPRGLEKILLTALAHNPARRYPDGSAMAADLGRFRRGEPVLARPPGRLVRLVESLHTAPGRARAVVTGATVLAVVAIAFVVLRGAGEVTPAERERASLHFDRAASLWIDGDDDAAHRELDRARRLDPREPTARLLATHLEGGREAVGETPCLREAGDGLRFYADSAFTEAIARFRNCSAGELRASFVSAVVGISLAGVGELAAAREELTAAARLLPASVGIQRHLAAVCERLDRPEEAARAYRRAAELAPDSLDLWADLAAVLLRQRNLDEGFRVLAIADSLAPAEHPRLLQIRGGLEMHAGRRADALRHLERALVLDPANVMARYQLAYAHDLDHAMVEAEVGYRGVLSVEPNHVPALVCLANLHSGASRGQCRGCDAAYAAHPRYLDLEKAEQYLLRCIEADRGANEWVTFSARDIALKLPRRDNVIRLLERLTASRDGSAGVLRLEDVLRRIRLVEE